jgi:FkbM family methyltransferase
MKNFKILDHTFIKFDNQDELVILDLGANIGEFYHTSVKIFGNSIKNYIGVEPSVKLYNDNLNNLNNQNVIFYNNAIASINGSEIDFFEFESAMDCGNVIGGAFLEWDGNVKTYKTKTITLDHIIKTNNLTKIDFLKIDIEGAEYDLIDGLNVDTLSIVKQISIEFHDFVDPNLRKKTKESVQKIKNFGFDLKHTEKSNFKHSTNYFDCLFVNKNVF